MSILYIYVTGAQSMTWWILSMTNRKLNLVGIRDTRHIYMTLVSECVHVWYLQRTFNVFDIFFPVLAGGCGVCMLISLWCCVFVCMHLSWCAVEGESINKLFEGCENFSMDWHVCRLFFFSVRFLSLFSPSHSITRTCSYISTMAGLSPTTDIILMICGVNLSDTLTDVTCKSLVYSLTHQLINRKQQKQKQRNKNKNIWFHSGLYNNNYIYFQDNLAYHLANDKCTFTIEQQEYLDIFSFLIWYYILVSFIGFLLSR